MNWMKNKRSLTNSVTGKKSKAKIKYLLRFLFFSCHMPRDLSENQNKKQLWLILCVCSRNNTR